MPRTPLYLSRDKHGVFHFRVRVPTHLRSHFNHKAEIKRSLKTDSRREAIRFARAYRVEFEKVIAQLNNKVPSNIFPLIRIKDLKLPNGTEVSDITIDYDGDEQKEMRALLALTGTGSSEQPASQAANPRLSVAIEKYLLEKITLDHWKERTATQAKATLFDFLQIVGNRPIGEITRETITEFTSIYGQLPPNRNKRKEFRGKSISEILKMSGYEPISRTTLKNNLVRVSTFFEWAKINNVINQDPTENITKILPKTARQKAKIDARDPFTADDLRALFHSEEFKKPKKPYQYWVPVIALYTGARIEEICSLTLANIKQQDDVWYFDITRSKTDAGRRQTPIHHQLIRLGLLDYVEQLKADGEMRLFPELKPTNAYEEVSPTASK